MSDLEERKRAQAEDDQRVAEVEARAYELETGIPVPWVGVPYYLPDPIPISQRPALASK
jgi:hypothetical protein